MDHPSWCDPRSCRMAYRDERAHISAPWHDEDKRVILNLMRAPGLRTALVISASDTESAVIIEDLVPDFAVAVQHLTAQLVHDPTNEPCTDHTFRRGTLSPR
jgi:hypothetical protein